jgi:formylglycine-generating enzyme required for sulfatase activity
MELELGKDLVMEFVLIPPGRFLMGPPFPVFPEIPQYYFHYKLGMVFTAIGFLPILLLVIKYLFNSWIRLAWPPYSLKVLIFVIFSLFFVFFGFFLKWEAKEKILYARNLTKEIKRQSVFDWPDSEKSCWKTISQPFYISRREISRAEFEFVMGQTGPNLGPLDEQAKVPWEKTWAFAHALSILTHRSFRIPREEEWEYALFAGKPVFIPEMVWDQPDTPGFQEDWNLKKYFEKTKKMEKIRENGFGVISKDETGWEWVAMYCTLNYLEKPKWMAGLRDNCFHLLYKKNPWIGHSRRLREDPGRLDLQKRNPPVSFRVVCEAKKK